MALKVVEELSLRFVTPDGTTINQFLGQGQAPIPIPRVGEHVKLPPKGTGSKVLGYPSHSPSTYGDYDVFVVVAVTTAYTRSFTEDEPGAHHLGLDYEVLVTLEPNEEVTYA